MCRHREWACEFIAKYSSMSNDSEWSLGTYHDDCCYYCAFGVNLYPICIAKPMRIALHMDMQWEHIVCCTRQDLRCGETQSSWDAAAVRGGKCFRTSCIPNMIYCLGYSICESISSHRSFANGIFISLMKLYLIINSMWEIYFLLTFECYICSD